MITLTLIVIFMLSTMLDYVFIKKSDKDKSFFEKHKFLNILFKTNQDFNLILMVILAIILMLEFLCFIYSI